MNEVLHIEKNVVGEVKRDRVVLTCGGDRPLELQVHHVEEPPLTAEAQPLVHIRPLERGLTEDEMAAINYLVFDGGVYGARKVAMFPWGVTFSYDVSRLKKNLPQGSSQQVINRHAQLMAPYMSAYVLYALGFTTEARVAEITAQLDQSRRYNEVRSTAGGYTDDEGNDCLMGGWG